MNLHLRLRAFLAVSIAGLLVATVPVVRAQAFYLVSKAQVFTQSSSAGAIPDPTGSFGFSAEAASNVTLAIPGGATRPVPSDGDGGFSLVAGFTSKAALDAAFPGGVYRMTGASIPALSFDLTNEAYPTATPQVTNGTWSSGGLLVVDAAQGFTLNFSTNTSYATAGAGGHMEFSVQGVDSNFNLNTSIVSRALFGMTASPTPFTTFVIPPGALTNGRVYSAELVFDTVAGADTTTIPNGGVVTLFSKALTFYIVAQTPGGAVPPPPVFVAQPVSQTGVLGGAVTFNIGVTVGGAPPTSLNFRWLFNGEELPGNSSKYTFLPGLGLRVNNLTAADVGAYSIRLISAGGVVTSAAANLTLGTAAPVAFTLQPASKTIAGGSSVVFTAAASGVPSPTYQWRRDGAPLQGATNATFIIVGTNPNQAGAYSVVATNGGNPATSDVATLTVVPNANDPGRLINLSILTDLTASVPRFTIGTVVGGGGTSGAKALLFRAAGPSLAQLGVTDALPDPKLELFTGQTSIGSNDDWAGSTALSAAFSQVGAFAYASAASKDAAILNTTPPPPGGYTVQISAASGTTGTVIAELYDSTPAAAYLPTTPRLINVSVLKALNAGGGLTAGFVVGGQTAKTVLIRAVGPTLGLPPFNIGGAMADPQLTLFNSGSVAIASNNDWGGEPFLVNTSGRVGAFALANPQTKDAVLLITLNPGNYTAQVSGVANTGGTAIVEVYEVP